MTDAKLTYYCSECGDEVTVLEGEEREDINGHRICMDCPEVPPWEDVDFPLWIEYESYNDTYRLGKIVERRTGVPADNIPIYRDMKYTVFTVWFKITEDSVEGPYRSKEGEKL